MKTLLMVFYSVGFWVPLISGEVANSNSIAKSNLRIINGNEAKIHSIPYQAFIRLYLPNRQISACGGTLVSRKFVLTAAHCCVNTTGVVVQLGGHKLKDFNLIDAVTFKVKKAVVHEQYYDAVPQNDLCVLELEKKAPINRNISVVRLPSKREAKVDLEGRKAIVSGWGWGNNYFKLATKLKFAEVEVVNDRVCYDAYNTNPPFFHIICTSGDTNKGACHGDSGGPLTIYDILIGVVSFGKQDCVLGYPSAYMRVTKYLDWIGKHTDVKISEN